MITAGIDAGIEYTEAAALGRDIRYLVSEATMED